MDIENKLLKIIKNNGNLIVEDDFLMLQGELNIDENALENHLKNLEKNSLINQVWVNPNTKTAQNEKDWEFNLLGYIPLYSYNFEDIL